MGKMIYLNTYGLMELDLYFLSIDNIADLATDFSLADQHFVLLLAWDARETENDEIMQIAKTLLDRGLVYLIAWGPDCERVHGMFDATANEDGWNIANEQVIMTTRHDEEPLKEAVWFFVFCAYPDEAFELTCKAGVAVAVGNKEWAGDIQAWLSDIPSLKAAVGF